MITYEWIKDNTIVEWYTSRLKVLKKWELRRIFSPKGDDVTWEWRKLHNE